MDTLRLSTKLREGSPHGRKDPAAVSGGVSGQGDRARSSSDRSINQIADELGVSGQTLRNWVHQAEVDGGKRGGLTTEERDELRALKRENKRLRMERDILKKAAAFFAKESEER